MNSEFFSIYRGQSDTGIGEGPGYSATRANQYLKVLKQEDGNSKELSYDDLQAMDVDAGLFETFRPWMTLHSKTEHHGRLRDKLEGWSYFTYKDFICVARLVSAGKDSSRRPIYFSHGRVWRRQAQENFDPGLYVGRSEAFEKPWRNNDPGTRIYPVPEAGIVGIEHIKKQKEIAKRFLAHLLQACEDNYLLIISAPLHEFCSGSPLYALIAFARAMLPAASQYSCNIRIYAARNLESLLRRGEKGLIALPDEILGDALRIEGNAALLDSQGMHSKSYPQVRKLRQSVQDYAEAMVEQVLTKPELQSPPRLVSFRRYIAKHYDGKNISALSKELIEPFIRQQAFEEAIVDASLQTHAEKDEIFKNCILYEKGEKSRRVLVEKKLIEDKYTADDALITQWWKTDYTDRNASSPEAYKKLRHLLELFDKGFISRKLAVELTAGISSDDINASGAPFVALIKAELYTGRIPDKHQWEGSDLAKLAESEAEKSKDIFSRLLDATVKGELSPYWLRAYFEHGELSQAVHKRIKTIRYLFKCRLNELFEKSTSWRIVLNELVGELNKIEPSRLPSKMNKPLLQTGEELRRSSHKKSDVLWFYIKLANLLELINQKNGDKENTLIECFWQEEFPKLEEGLKKNVFEFIKSDWCSFKSGSGKYLAGEDSIASKLWADGNFPGYFADFSIQNYVSNDTSFLLKLANVCDKANLEKVYQELDNRMRRERKDTTETLIKNNWWFSWTKHSELKSNEVRVAAWSWLTSRVQCERLLEDWNRVIGYLKKLSDVEMRKLTRDRKAPVWPWITPFEQRQVDDLCKLAWDLGALVTLGDTLQPLWQKGGSDESVYDYLLERSVFKKKLPKNSLLLLKGYTVSKEITFPTFEQLHFLYENTGNEEYQKNVMDARIRAVVKHLNEDLSEALAQANEIKTALADSKELLNGISEWIRTWVKNKKISDCDDVISKIGVDNTRNIEKLLGSSLPPADKLLRSSQFQRLASELATNNYPNIAKHIGLQAKKHNTRSAKPRLKKNQLRGNVPSVPSSHGDMSGRKQSGSTGHADSGVQENPLISKIRTAVLADNKHEFIMGINDWVERAKIHRYEAFISAIGADNARNIEKSLLSSFVLPADKPRLPLCFQMLASELVKNDYPNIAECIYPGIQAETPYHTAATVFTDSKGAPHIDAGVQGEPLASKIMTSLFEWNSDDGNWKIFREEIERLQKPGISPVDVHPLIEFADKLEEYNRCKQPSWDIRSFEKVINKYPILLTHCNLHGQPDIIPAFRIVTLVKTPVPIRVAGWIMLKADIKDRQNPQWWIALYNTISQQKDRGIHPVMLNNTIEAFAMEMLKLDLKEAAYSALEKSKIGSIIKNTVLNAKLKGKRRMISNGALHHISIKMLFEKAKTSLSNDEFLEWVKSCESHNMPNPSRSL